MIVAGTVSVGDPPADGALAFGGDKGAPLRQTLFQLMQLFPQGCPFLHVFASAGATHSMSKAIAANAIFIMLPIYVMSVQPSC